MLISKKKYKDMQTKIKAYYKLIDVIVSQEKTINQYHILLNKMMNFQNNDIDFPNSEERGFNTANTGCNDDPNDILFN